MKKTIAHPVEDDIVARKFQFKTSKEIEIDKLKEDIEDLIELQLIDKVLQKQILSHMKQTLKLLGKEKD